MSEKMVENPRKAYVVNQSDGPVFRQSLTILEIHFDGMLP